MLRRFMHPGPSWDDLGGEPDWPDDRLEHLGGSLEGLAVRALEMRPHKTAEDQTRCYRALDGLLAADGYAPRRAEVVWRWLNGRFTDESRWGELSAVRWPFRDGRPVKPKSIAQIAKCLLRRESFPG